MMKLFDALAMGLCLGLAINLVGIFFTAAFHGGEVLVTVNTLGEQWIEVFLFPVIIIMGVVTFIRMLKDGG